MATSLPSRTSTAAAKRSGPPSSRTAVTSESSIVPATPQRTTSTVAPFATKPAANAAENVAMPQAVGGNVDSNPYDRIALSSDANRDTTLVRDATTSS
jgi:hypothetical protein